MSNCPLVQLATNLKLLKQFEQTGQVVIPLSDWIRFFEALAFLKCDGGSREIYCAFAGEYLAPIERGAKKEPTQAGMFERGKRPALPSTEANLRKVISSSAALTTA